MRILTPTLLPVTALLALFIVSGASTARQPPEPPNRPVDPAERAERAMERRAEQAVRQAERLERQLPDVAQHAQDKAMQAVQQRLENLPAQAVQRGPIRPLDPTLDVFSQRGERLFREIEIEPFIRVVQQEWLLLVTEPEWRALQRANNPIIDYIVEHQRLESLSQQLLTLRVPTNMDSQAALEAELPEPLRTRLERQHVYQLQSLPAQATAALQHELTAVCQHPLKIGVIDTQVDTSLPVFNDSRQQLQQRLIVDPANSSTPLHGTAIAALLIGHAPSQLNPLLPNASIYQAAAFYQQTLDHQGSRTADILRGLDWLHSEQVKVVNMSFAGPPNALLELAIAKLNDAGISLVAAVGNQGPHAPPQFPAAYPNVIAVTAVDADGELYPWAVRGDHIDFSALGVDIALPKPSSEWALESGTSLAAPVVSAFAGCFHEGSTSVTRQRLQELVIPVAEPGAQADFGLGLLHPSATLPR